MKENFSVLELKASYTHLVEHCGLYCCLSSSVIIFSAFPVMVCRAVSMLSVIGKFALVVVFVCLLCPSFGKPSSGWWSQEYLDQVPPYIECRTSSECFDKHQCCKIGRQRFSIPVCAPYGGPGDMCSPGAVAVFKNLSYPDGITVQFRGIYDELCPCAFGLYCHQNLRICVSDNLPEEENALEYEVKNRHNHSNNRY